MAYSRKIVRYNYKLTILYITVSNMHVNVLNITKKHIHYAAISNGKSVGDLLA